MAFVFSTVHLLLMLRALVVSVRGRFGFGIAGGAVRLLLLVVGALLAVGNGALVVTRHVAAGGSAAEASALVSVALLGIAIAGPLLTLALVIVAYRRCQEVPAAQEAELQKPFDAWLLVGAQDLLGVVIAVAASWFASSGP